MPFPSYIPQLVVGYPAIHILPDSAVADVELSACVEVVVQGNIEISKIDYALMVFIHLIIEHVLIELSVLEHFFHILIKHIEAVWHVSFFFQSE